MDRCKYDRVSSLVKEIRQLQEELFDLLRDEDLQKPVVHLAEAIDRLDQEVQRRTNEYLHAALVRVNLRDEQYTCIRVIDGDTLEVEPPEELRGCTRDVHVRLYGVDTPERNQELGPAYAELLDSLCMGYGQRKVSIIWERERQLTEYAGFPRSSFERGIGNVFIRVDDYVLYVNAFLAMLPGVSVERNQQTLIRGQRLLAQKLPPVAWQVECTTEMPKPIAEALLGVSAVHYAHRWRFPVCLCMLPREVIPSDARSPVEAWRLLVESMTNHGCPYGPVATIAQSLQLEDQVQSRNISPFDLLLLLASEWQSVNGA